MYSLVNEITRRSCAFVAELDFPLKTIAELMLFFDDRRIIVDTLQMQVSKNAGTTLFMVVQVEKDRIRHTVSLLKKMPGIIKLEWFESKGSE